MKKAKKLELRRQVKINRGVDMEYTKAELMDIYNKAKKGNFDLNLLSLEELKMFNILIEEEIKLKAKKLYIKNKVN